MGHLSTNFSFLIAKKTESVTNGCITDQRSVIPEKMSRAQVVLMGKNLLQTLIAIRIFMDDEFASELDDTAGDGVEEEGEDEEAEEGLGNADEEETE